MQTRYIHKKGKILNPLRVNGNLNILQNTTKFHYTSLYILQTKIKRHTTEFKLQFTLDIIVTQATYIIPTTLYHTELTYKFKK